jgi:hypothetical protein
MESNAIPTDVTVEPRVLETLQALADRRGLVIDETALNAAAVLDTWLAPHQLALRAHELSYLDLVEPGTVFQWIERGGRSVGA